MDARTSAVLSHRCTSRRGSNGILLDDAKGADSGEDAVADVEAEMEPDADAEVDNREWAETEVTVPRRLCGAVPNPAPLELPERYDGGDKEMSEKAMDMLER